MYLIIDFLFLYILIKHLKSMKNKMFKYCSNLSTFYNQHPSASSSDDGYIVSADSSTVIGTPGILWENICFIETEKLVWTHGQFFADTSNIYSYVQNAYSYVLSSIEDNEYVTAYGFVQLNDKIERINLSTYVTKAELSANSYVKQSKLNSCGYVSKTELSAQSYVKSEDISSLINGNFVSYEYLSSQSYVVNNTLNDYITKTDLTNQSYLTSSALNDYLTKTELSNQSYITLNDLSSYITRTEVSNQSYAGYSYVYEAYSYVMDKIAILELNSGSGSGTVAEGGITSILFNSTPATITGSVASISAPINDSTITIQKNNTTVDTFTLNQSSNKSINISVNELPTVTSSNNGYILMVVNGAWSLVSPATIYSGNAQPANINGNNGDLYIQS